MILWILSLINTRTDMASIWQWDNKNSNQRLKKRKRTKIIVSEPLRFIFLLSVNQLPKSNICLQECKSNKDIPYTSHKYKKNHWNEKYSIFFAGSVYQYLNIKPLIDIFVLILWVMLWTIWTSWLILLCWHIFVVLLNVTTSIYTGIWIIRALT